MSLPLLPTAVALAALVAGCLCFRSDPYRAQDDERAAARERLRREQRDLARPVIEACGRGEAVACVRYCTGQVAESWAAEDDVKLRSPEICRRACESGDLDSCVKQGAFLVLKPETREVARGHWTRACDAGKAEGCALLAKWFAESRTDAMLAKACDGGSPECASLLLANPGVASRALVERTVERWCQGRSSVACFMKAMNHLGHGGPVEEVLALARAAKEISRPMDDYFAPHRLIECLTGLSNGWADASAPEDVGAPLDPSRRQQACLDAEVIASTNFPHLRTYAIAPGRLPSVPWSSAPEASDDVSVLPRGKGWACCGYTPKYGYTGPTLSWCERDERTCGRRMARYRADANYEVTNSKVKPKTAWCYTSKGLDTGYSCTPEELTCRRNAGRPCVRWGND